VGEQVRGALFGQAGLPGDLDGDGPHELTAEGLVALEHDAEGAAGLHLGEPVFAGEGAAEQAGFERGSVGHGWSPERDTRGVQYTAATARPATGVGGKKPCEGANAPRRATRHGIPATPGGWYNVRTSRPRPRDVGR